MIDLINSSDLVVFSINGFDSKDLRTIKLLKEVAAKKRVYFIDTPVIGMSQESTYFLKKGEHEVSIIQPYLPAETSLFDQKKATLELLKELINDENINDYTIWTDSPKAMYFIRHLSPVVIIYDCQQDFSVKYAELEKELLEYADIVLKSESVKFNHTYSFKNSVRNTDSQERYV